MATEAKLAGSSLNIARAMKVKSARGARRSENRVYVLMRSKLMRESVGRLLQGEGTVTVVGSGGPSEVSEEQIVISGCDVLIVDFLDLDWLERFREACHCFERKVKIVAMGTGRTGLPEGAEAYVSENDSSRRLVAEARRERRLTSARRTQSVNSEKQ